jgi:Gene product 88
MLRVSRGQLAEKITGGLSQPGKMPCYAWGISAFRCRVGSKLAEQEGTVCSECYARKRNYLRQNVQDKLEERFQGLSHELWTPAMAFLIGYFSEGYFRMFDSGDFMSESHIKNTIQIAEALPEVKIWCPSREIQMIRSVLRERITANLSFPDNLILRISANLIDGKPPRGFPYTSAVVSDPEKATCVAQRQGNRCDGAICNCRACWHEPHVSYPWH